MIGYWRPLAVCVVLLGAAALLFSGVKQLWSANDPTLVGATPTSYDPVPPIPDEPAPPPAKEPVVVVQPKPLPTPHLPIEPAAVKQETVRKRILPNGNNHAPQDKLLTAMMTRLHGEANRQFIKAPGNGSNREIAMMVTTTIKPRLWTSPEWTSEELAKETPPLQDANDLTLIHRLSVFNFGESAAKSSQEQWFQLMAPLSAKKQQYWEIKSLDLVGLVMHDEPVVYMSDTLPEMKDLKKKTIRPLDVFESEGLEELASGKELYVRSKEGTVRVLGPIHAGKACLKCHQDTKEGDLLGAFSYTLRVAQLETRNSRPGPGQPFVGFDQDDLRGQRGYAPKK